MGVTGYEERQRGLAAGIAAGNRVDSWAEAALAWWERGASSRRWFARTVAATDLGAAGIAGLLAGLVMPRCGRRTLAVVVAGAYGLLRRVCAPGHGGGSGLRGSCFGAVAAVATLRASGSDAPVERLHPDDPRSARLGVLLGDAWLDDHHCRRAPRPVAPRSRSQGSSGSPILADGLMSLAVRSAGRRLVAAGIRGRRSSRGDRKRRLTTAPLGRDRGHRGASAGRHALTSILGFRWIRRAPTISRRMDTPARPARI